MASDEFPTMMTSREREMSVKHGCRGHSSLSCIRSSKAGGLDLSAVDTDTYIGSVGTRNVICASHRSIKKKKKKKKKNIYVGMYVCRHVCM